MPQLNFGVAARIWIEFYDLLGTQTLFDCLVVAKGSEKEI